ncbi:F0F1 ATP synthase subunit epsilon [Sinisalibacter aestuarii]|uniref:ATP synthase epsilon chain n=1 Tax=Sinisalibacter aestuarii TaxID=2949426 RepID=A0ABQ5LPP9_9RHOB|nr:F0F1 ATP synthase subunit epsilon [Sinisalibacter aestuarii]GKY86982.1 ATP synthase epsilon chain 1 [Sinisalibacter aestuarii]
MADMMQFDLVSPARRLASGEASAVQIPGADGDFTAMANHAPTIATLRPGIVTVQGASGEEKYVVTGGFAEISPSGTSVLAERAMPVSEVTQEVMDEFVTAAVAARDNAQPEMLDQLAKQVGDIAQVAAELGLQAKAS